MLGFNVGVTISLGDMELAIDYMNEEKDAMEEKCNNAVYKCGEEENLGEAILDNRDNKEARDKENIDENTDGGKNKYEEDDAYDEDYSCEEDNNYAEDYDGYEEDNDYYADDDYEDNYEDGEEIDDKNESHLDEYEINKETTGNGRSHKKYNEKVTDTDRDEAVQKDKKEGPKEFTQEENKRASRHLEKQLDDMIDTENKRKVKEPVNITNKTYDIYDDMDVDSLYREVKKYMTSMGVDKRLIVKSQLEKEFGVKNIKKLIMKSYLISLGNKITMGR